METTGFRLRARTKRRDKQPQAAPTTCRCLLRRRRGRERELRQRAPQLRRLPCRCRSRKRVRGTQSYWTFRPCLRSLCARLKTSTRSGEAAASSGNAAGLSQSGMLRRRKTVQHEIAARERGLSLGKPGLAPFSGGTGIAA